MAKFDLKKSLGFSVVVENGEIIETELPYSTSSSFTLDEMKSQILNDEITCPDIFYTKYTSFDKENVYKERGIAINLYIVPSNLAGIEFVKTKGMICSRYNRILEVLYGGGMMIMQNFNESNEGDIITSTLRRDMKIIVPPGYTVCFVNTRSTALVINEISKEVSREVNELDEMGGMAYYVIRKNAKQEIVRNPNYKLIGKARKIQWDKITGKFGITLKTPIIKQILRKYDKFNWLFKETPIEI